MSDASVWAALRTTERLVLVEAPAGCGKTYQAAEYARDIADSINPGRLLILAHTHAACDVFARRTKGLSKVEIRTIDSLIGSIASAYHKSLNLPHEPLKWAYQTEDGFKIMSEKASRLVEQCPSIAKALARRFPVIICDEHQDASIYQHRLIMALYRSGARLRIFGDPMQRIYPKTKQEWRESNEIWVELEKSANSIEMLNYPHRWQDAPELGTWILNARELLKANRPINLKDNLPPGLKVLIAENISPKWDGYQITKEHSGLIYDSVRNSASALVLAGNNGTVQAVNSFFYRSLQIWQGHSRDLLPKAAKACTEANNEPNLIAQELLSILENIGTGFQKAKHGKMLLEEVTTNCTKRESAGRKDIRVMAQKIIEQPNHKGLSSALHHLDSCRNTESALKGFKIDLLTEYREIIELGSYEDPHDAIAYITRRRTFMLPLPKQKSISTVHKAKGLEFDNVVVMPIDLKHYSATDKKRNLLYVALSRSTRSLTLVLSKDKKSPLVDI